MEDPKVAEENKRQFCTVTTQLNKHLLTQRAPKTQQTNENTKIAESRLPQTC